MPLWPSAGQAQGAAPPFTMTSLGDHSAYSRRAGTRPVFYPNLSRSSMENQMTGRMKCYTVLMDDFELSRANRLEKMSEGYPLKLWVKDSTRHCPYVTIFWEKRGEEARTKPPSPNLTPNSNTPHILYSRSTQ